MYRQTTMLVFSLTLTAALAGCADRTFFGKPPTWPREGAAPIFPTLEPAQREHFDVPGGVIEVWQWDMQKVTAEPRGRLRKADAQPRAVVLLSGEVEAVAQTYGEYLARLYRGLDILAYAWNYPGIGSSTGPVDLQGMLDASLAVFDQLLQRHPDTPIIVQGIGLGAGPALYINSERKVAGVIVDSSVRANEVPYELERSWWNLWIGSLAMAAQIPKECDPARTAYYATRDCPLLVIHGEDDEAVPVQHSMEVFNRWPFPRKQLLVIPKAGHYPGTLETAREDYREAVFEVLKQIPRNLK